MAVDPRHGLGRKHRRAVGIRSRQLQAALNVAAGFFEAQRLELRTQCDALLQLPQFKRVKLQVKFRLADQQNLQQLALGSLEVGQQADLFEYFHFQVMGFVLSGGMQALSDWTEVGDFRDTVPALAGALKIRFLAHHFAGEITTHCHVLPHEDQGLMSSFLIIPSTTAAPSSASSPFTMLSVMGLWLTLAMILGA